VNNGADAFIFAPHIEAIHRENTAKMAFYYHVRKRCHILNAQTGKECGVQITHKDWVRYRGCECCYNARKANDAE
jgi:hypothetical protein